MPDVNPLRFPCDRYPGEPAHARLLGLYNQRQEGLLMQRVKVHTGALTAAQLRTIAGLAATRTPGYPLHLTTRQDVELHGLRPEDVPAVQRGLHGAGLTTVGACGDTLRNVTVCPLNGVCPDTFDVSQAADAIRAAAESLPWIRCMPRKFKISISGCEKACGKPWINDLGLVARPEGSFRAVVAGSLGPRPGTGIEFKDVLSAADIVPFALAALTLFNAEGDRKNRSQARLRHVRERIGDEAFLGRIAELFEEEKRKAARPQPELRRVALSQAHVIRLQFPLGDIQPEEALRLAESVERAGAAMRVGFEHDLYLYGPHTVELDKDLLRLVDAPRIVACPGSTWCQRGIADSRAAAERIGLAIPRDSALSICVNGCPNNCGHAPVADGGLVGRIRTIGGARTECFQLLAGGGKGQSPALAQELSSAVPADRVDGAVARLLDEYRSGRKAGEAFADFVVREKVVLSRKIQELS